MSGFSNNHLPVGISGLAFNPDAKGVITTSSVGRQSGPNIPIFVQDTQAWYAVKIINKSRLLKRRSGINLIYNEVRRTNAIRIN